MEKVGLGGSCHWCTEAIFQALKGVDRVDQGWISSNTNGTLSEAVIVYFNPIEIPLKVLIEIHLMTHSCTSKHSLRGKYRSAIYTFNIEQKGRAIRYLKNLQLHFDRSIITKVLDFDQFKLNQDVYLNYYSKNPKKPFRKVRIEPKLQKVLREYNKYVKV